jgi:hypothetical protein
MIFCLCQILAVIPAPADGRAGPLGQSDPVFSGYIFSDNRGQKRKDFNMGKLSLVFFGFLLKKN